jgi:hypothetical protein
MPSPESGTSIHGYLYPSVHMTLILRGDLLDLISR